MSTRVILVAGLALLGAACGGEAEETTTTAAETTTTTAMETTTAADAETTTTAAGAASSAVAVADTDLGTILVDGEGRTLYAFVPDDQGEPTCYDDCATNWPPLDADVAAGDGVDSSLLGSVARTDGAAQATYNGWPLYRFAADFEPGDIEGQGVQDVWFVVDPDGELVTG